MKKSTAKINSPVSEFKSSVAWCRAAAIKIKKERESSSPLKSGPLMILFNVIGLIRPFPYYVSWIGPQLFSEDPTRKSNGQRQQARNVNLMGRKP